MHASSWPEGLAAARGRYPLLYVDDEPDNLLVFRACLGEDFAVLTCDSGEQALRLLEEQEVVLLVTDQRMPGLSGVDLCERVRLRHGHVRRILMTAYADQQTAIEAINRGGVHGFVTKPWSEPELRQLLLGQLERVHLERQVHQLRSTISEHERALGLSTARERLLHDVAGVTFRLGLLCTQLERLLAPGLAGLTEHSFSRVRAGLGRIRRVADHLAQLHAGRNTLSPAQAPEWRSVGELVESAVALAGVEHLGGVRLRVRGTTGLRAWVDPVSATRILVNLLNNAVEAMQQEGGPRGRLMLDVADQEGGRFVRIDVVDSGPGVPPALRERIFEELFTTRRERGGSGIGLSSSRALAEAGGGSLELVPSAGAGGARFRLRLPALPTLPARRSEERHAFPSQP